MEETVEMEVFQGSAIKRVRKLENKKNQIFRLVFFLEQFPNFHNLVGHRRRSSLDQSHGAIALLHRTDGRVALLWNCR